MAYTSVSDYVATFLEKVSPQMEQLVQGATTLADKCYNQVEKIEVGRGLIRQVVEKYNSVRMAKHVQDGGTLLQGVGGKRDKFFCGYFPFQYVYGITQDMITSSNSTEKGIEDIMAKQQAILVEEVAVYRDVICHGDGQGFLTNASNTTTGTTMTFDAPTDTLRTLRLKEGMTVDVWTADGNTKRAVATPGTPLIIINIDDSTHTVTFNQAVTAIANGDAIALEGLDAGALTPQLRTGQAGYPGTPFSATAAGIGGDSAPHGMEYQTGSAAQYANRYGVSLATTSKMAPISMDAAGQVDYSLYFRLSYRWTQRWPKESLSDLMSITSQAQKSRWAELALNNSIRVFQGMNSGDGIAQLLPTGVNTNNAFMFGDIPTITSQRVRADRWHFLFKKGLRKVVQHEFAPMSMGGLLKNNGVFEDRTTTGQATASVSVVHTEAYDFLHTNCGKNMQITGATTPVGWII